jgi:DNA (cytosine-5)-methyltransferase 1
MSLRVSGLFAGVGGLEFGLGRAGHKTVQLCEIDEGARAVLAGRFPGAKLTADVRELGDLGDRIDLVTAGFPCQDLSQVGQTAGLSGSSSGLVSNVFRLVRQRKPKWVLLENVPFMLKLDGGFAIRKITRRFELLGYKWAYRVIDSHAFGLPQRRLRVFVLAGLDVDPRNVLLCSSVLPVEQKWALRDAAHGFYWTEGNRGVGWAENAIPALKGGSGCFIPSPPGIIRRNREIVTPTIEACERLQGFPPGWTEPALRVGYKRRRWAYVGNAVSVPVAEWIGHRLANPISYDSKVDAALDEDSGWPNAAWFDGKRRCKSNASTWPISRKTRDLEMYIGSRYRPLSGRATAGFLCRLEHSSLRVSEDFKKALRRHIGRMNAFPIYFHLTRQRQRNVDA